MVHHSRATQLIGEFIDNGRLLLVEILGAGATGIVYRALDTTSDPNDLREFAVKWILKPSLDSENYDRSISRICDEMDFHKRVLGHPNILPFHRVIEDGPSIFIVLELLSADLHSMINVRKAYHGRDALIKSVFLQIIDALQHCHDNSVYHRDLKPENIMCSEDGARIYLADFGLATMNDHIGDDFGCGTAPYMSPECLGHEYGLASYSTAAGDVWALGIILVNLITGKHPWRTASTTDGAFSAYLHHPDFFKRLLPVSSQAETIFRSIFTVNPSQRVTLAQLRRQVVACDSFCLSGDELARAPRHIRLIADYYSGCIPSTILAASQISDWSNDSSDDFIPSNFILAKSLQESGDYVFESPLSSWPRILSSDCFRYRSPSSSSSDRDNELDYDSEDSDDTNGPVTPETHAVDPMVEIPDFSLAAVPAFDLEATKTPLPRGSTTLSGLMTNAPYGVAVLI